MFTPKLPRVKPGDPISATAFNAIVDLLNRAQNLTVGQGLAMHDTPMGRLLRLDRRQKRLGQIVSGSNPYAWNEVARDSGGTLRVIAPGRGAAYHINGSTSIAAGKVVWMHPGASDWRFATSRRGCAFQITVNNRCGGHVSGATVTIDGETHTTDGSGVAHFVGAYVGASGTITATGFCDATFTVPALCANLTVTMYPTTVAAVLKATLCCGSCPPSATYPVSLSITQTAGGSDTNSCTITSSAGCTFSLPAPCPGTTDNVFSLAWSSSGFTSKTTTLTLPNAAISWVCSPTVTVDLETPDGDYCFPADNCLGAYPASVTVAIDRGTWVIPLSGNGATCTISGQISVGGSDSVAVFINQTGSCRSAVGAVAYFQPGNPFFPVEHYSMVSGTADCPIAFSVGGDLGGSGTVFE